MSGNINNILVAHVSAFHSNATVSFTHLFFFLLPGSNMPLGRGNFM